MPESPVEFADLERGSIVTLGAFDGVHRGHQQILRRVLERAGAAGLPAVAMTFRPHPLEVLKPEAAPLLLTPGDEQLVALTAQGIERTVLLDFTPALAELDARAFVERVLIGRCHMRELVIGYNHKLGRGREGDAVVLGRLGEALGFAVHVVPATLAADGSVVSSTAIRTAIGEGHAGRAAALLGRSYALRGVVVQGHQRGRLIGYPTMNVRPDEPRKLLPADGVYAVRATTPAGEFGGMMNVGGRPTFGELERTVEVHLFESVGAPYGAAVSVSVIHRLRNVMRFAGPEALVAQLAKDAEAARLALTQA